MRAPLTTTTNPNPSGDKAMTTNNTTHPEDIRLRARRRLGIRRDVEVTDLDLVEALIKRHDDLVHAHEQTKTRLRRARARLRRGG